MTADAIDFMLPVIDGLNLPAAQRDSLRPGQMAMAADGRLRQLPRYFYRVDSWGLARDMQLTPHFGLWEFIEVDIREAAPLHLFPRYVPCAVTLLAAVLELFRFAVGAPVRVAVNGGYRSPSHAQSRDVSLHCWAAAADIFAIGPDLLDSDDRLDRYGGVARAVLPFASVLPAFDHLHVEIGYVALVPTGAPGHEDAASLQGR